MANYSESGNRWTAVYSLRYVPGQERYEYSKMPWELVRFNVDSNPSAEAVIVPIGEEYMSINVDNVKPDSGKVYERIWIVDTIPFREKVKFGSPE